MSLLLYSLIPFVKALDWALEKWKKLSRVPTALALIGVLSIVAIPLCILPFVLGGVPAFFGILSVGMLLLFSSTSPLNGLILWVVPEEMQPFSVAMCNIWIHLLGDVPSPPITGALLHSTHYNWRLTMTLVACWLLFVPVVWCTGYVLGKNKKNGSILE